MRTALLLLSLLLAVLTPTSGYAQTPPDLSEEAQISMLTVLPGNAVYSAFGHSAFRVQDPAYELDWTFNYGTFEFRDPLFIPKFIYGKLDYLLSVSYYESTLQSSQDQGRPVIEQVLNLDAEHRNALFRFLVDNALPENRTYRYDFLFDNCATRIRDALQTALGETVQFAPLPDPQQPFRLLLDPYVADRPFLDFGFDLALGLPTDRVARPEETVFLPLFLQEAFDHATVLQGEERLPLVARTDTVLWIEGYSTATSSIDWALVLGWLLLGLGLGFTAWQYRQGRAAATEPRFRSDCWLFGIAGAAGVLLLFLWIGTLHVVTQLNMNLLWLWPTHLVAALLLRKRRPAWLTLYFLATGVLTFVVVLGWVLWPQHFHPAFLPLMLLLILRSLWLWKQLRTPR